MPKTANEQKKRGRPTKLSREKVLDTGLKILTKGKDELTINAVARQLKVTPMTLYTHVENRDDLVNGVSDLVMQQLELDIDPDATWQNQVKQWIMQIHTHFSLYPQVVSLLGQSAQPPPQWLRLHIQLMHILYNAGIRGEGYSSAVRWIAHAIVGDILVNASNGLQTPSKVREGSLNDFMASLSAEDQEVLGELVQHIIDPKQSFLEFKVDQLIAGLEALKSG